MPGGKTYFTTMSCVITICSFFVLIGWVMEDRKPLFDKGKKLYAHYCTPCHGINGNGKGFNAKNLDPRPADHTNTQFMRKRSDKDLYDAIRGGGKAVGKSPLMPPWGKTLNDEQIKALILYLRYLCGCTGDR